MPETTFDPTDPDDIAAREAEEKRLLELGDKIVSEEEAIVQRKYEQAKEEADAQQNYAGKFRSAEELEKAYLELQKKLGQKDDQTSQEGEEEESEAESAEEEATETVSEEAQLLLDASEEYYSNNNQLKPETIEKLKELPSEKLIEAYMKLQQDNPIQKSQPLSDADAQQIVQAVGGKEAYDETLAWAADNLTPAEVAAYDNVVNSGNKDAIFFAVQALNQRYKDAVGFEGKTISGKSVKSSVKGFRSQAELARAISDPRYRNDPAYRYDIEERLSASGDLI